MKVNDISNGIKDVWYDERILPNAGNYPMFFNELEDFIRWEMKK